MSAVDRYVAELGGCTRTRGRARRRFLTECRDHLDDAAAERGAEAAVLAFGPAPELAAAFDAEVAARRGLRSTIASVAAVLATGGSTLVLIGGAAPGAAAPAAWAVVFFVAAQVAVVATGLALVQAVASRRAPASPADGVLLARRNACAVTAAGMTLVAAGVALPGHAAALGLLAGPASLCAALAAVVRARSATRALDGASARVVRPPLEDLGRLAGLRVPRPEPVTLLALTACVAAAAAFVRDRAERGTPAGALAVAAIEASAVVVCFVVLGPALGLWGRRSAPARAGLSRGPR